MSNKTFNEEAVREIVRLAMENEEQEDHTQSDRGVTIEELVQIGKEVGLSETEIRAAANKYSSNFSRKKSSVTKTSNNEERIFISKASKDLVWDFLQAELDDHYGESSIFGNLSAPTRNYKWKHSSATGVETMATLRNVENGYKLKLSETVGMASPKAEGIAIGLIPMLLFGIGVLVFNEGAWFQNIILTSAFWGISSYIIYKLDLAWRNKRRNRLKELADTLISSMPDEFTEAKEEARSQTSIEIEDEEVYGKKETGNSELSNRNALEN